MAILSTVIKDYIRQKTDAGYITLKPKTDADCVKYINSDAIETDVQTELDEVNTSINELENNLPKISGSLNDWLFFEYPNGYIEAHRFYQLTGIACSTSIGGEYASGNIWVGSTPSYTDAIWTGGYGMLAVGSMSGGARFHRISSINDNGAVRAVIACRTSSTNVSFPIHIVLTGTVEGKFNGGAS